MLTGGGCFCGVRGFPFQQKLWGNVSNIVTHRGVFEGLEFGGQAAGDEVRPEPLCPMYRHAADDAGTCGVAGRRATPGVGVPDAQAQEQAPARVGSKVARAASSQGSACHRGAHAEGWQATCSDTQLHA